MPSSAQILIHPSQFPEAVSNDLAKSLRSRQINHKFHYDSVKQTQKWLALHQAYSPSRTDADCAATYDRSFAAVATQIKASAVHLIGLGCGGGQKDSRLLNLLQKPGRLLSYSPVDVSVAMVLVAREAALAQISENDCQPFVCDLANADDLPEIFDKAWPDSARVITFFGMIPNFEPYQILSRLATLVRPDDYLLFSANLAPGDNYSAGVRQVLPLYDNPLTRDWLMTFLFDLGVERTDGDSYFIIEGDTADAGFKRISAYFQFHRAFKFYVDDATYDYEIGERIRLFFSYRYTPGQIRTLLEQHSLKVLDQWITKSGEEGVFLCKRT